MKEQQVCRDFLKLHCYDQTHDAISAMQTMIEIWGIRVDWHEFSYALDRMEQAGEAQRARVGYDRMTCYTIKGENDDKH